MTNFVFNIYAIPPLVSLCVIVGLAVYVYAKNPYGLLNKLFILFLVLTAIWAVSEIVNTLTVSRVIIEHVLRGGAIGWNFLGPVFLLFILFFVRRDRLAKNFLFLFALTSISLAILFLIWRTNVIVNYELVRTVARWDSPPGKYFSLFSLWLSALFLFSFFLVLDYYRKAKIKEEKNQAILIFFAILPSFVFGMLSQVVLPLFFRVNSVMLEAIIFPLTSLSLAFFLGTAIVRYKLFIVSPSLVIPSIINTMSETLLVFNTSLYIEFVNRTALDLLGYKEPGELVGKKMDHIVVGGNVWDTFFRRAIGPLGDGRQVRNLELKFLTKEGREVSVNFSASPIRNPSGEVTGIVSLAYDIGDTKKLIRNLEEKLFQLKDTKHSLERALGGNL